VVGQSEETENRLKELLRLKARPTEAAKLEDPDMPLDELFPTT
jgi:hypothetical protein